MKTSLMRALLKKTLAPALLLLIFPAAEALACSCATSQPCQGYWEASAVFVGRRVGVRTEEVEEGTDEHKYKRQLRVYRFAVEQMYRGPKAEFVEVRTGTGGGDCGISFNASERYLVYAYGDEERGGALSTSICTRTAPVSKAAEDLQYIASLSSSTKQGGIIYGQAQKQVREQRGAERDEMKYVPVAGAKVEVTGGGKTFEVETDSEGRFRAEGLAPGEYTVRLKVPETLFVHGPERKVKIVGSGCVAEWFSVETNGRISGRVFDSEGRPAAKVALIVSDPQKGAQIYNGYTYTATTDDEGRYEFHAVPPGRYVIRLRFDGNSPFGGSPFPVVFHPNARNMEEAEKIEVRDGEKVENFDLHLPPPFAERMIEGVVTYPDGAPAAGAMVNYSSPGVADSSGSVKTDAEGRFSFKGFEALAYKLYSSVWSESKKEWLSAKVIEVPSGGAVPPVRIVVPRP